MNWNNLSIKQVKSINKISSNKELKPEEKTVKIISIVYNLDEENVWTMPLPIINAKAEECKFLSEQPKYKIKKIDKVNINGVDYEAVYDFSKFTYSQYVDFQCFMGQKDNMSEVLSTILVPKGKTYNKDYELKDTINDIENYVDIETANSILGFFFEQLKSLTRQYLELLKKTLKKNKKLSKEERERIQTIIKNTQSIIG